MLDGRPGSTGRLVAGAGVAAVLVGALVVSLFEGGGDVSTALRTTTTTTTTTTGPAPADISTAFKDDDTSYLSRTSRPVRSVGDIRVAGDAVLAAWGRFAVSGDLSEVDAYFHGNSPQLPLLAAKATRLGADPLGEPAYAFEMASPRIEEDSPGMATMQGLVTAFRGHAPPLQFEWRLVLARSDDPPGWLLWTLEELD